MSTLQNQKIAPHCRTASGMCGPLYGKLVLYRSRLIYRSRLTDVKPVTDEQVFYDKFSYDKFYLSSARVYMPTSYPGSSYLRGGCDLGTRLCICNISKHILYDKFSYDKFYFTGVNVSTSLL